MLADQSRILALIGNVLYWTCTAIAVFLALGTVAVLVLGSFDVWGFKPENNVLEAFVFIPALLIWLLGRACRYLLARE
jgi:hypothetical protein